MLYNTATVTFRGETIDVDDAKLIRVSDDTIDGFMRMEYSAPGRRENGSLVTVYWAFSVEIGDNRDPADYDWDRIDRVVDRSLNL